MENQLSDLQLLRMISRIVLVGKLQQIRVHTISVSIPALDYTRDKQLRAKKHIHMNPKSKKPCSDAFFDAWRAKDDAWRAEQHIRQ